MDSQTKSANKILANSLAEAKKVSKEGVLKGTDLDRQTRERLISAGCLTEIIKGWYLFTKPGVAGNSTAWFGGLWSFVRYYLSERFTPDGYCLSAESSLDLQVGDGTITNQIVVLTKRSSNQTVTLLHDTSLLLYHDEKNFPETVGQYNGINVVPIPIALCRITSSYFQNKSLNVEIALRMASSSISDILRYLLQYQSSTIANRLAGAYSAIKDDRTASQIIQSLAPAGMTIQPENPFKQFVPRIEQVRLKSPYAGRIEAMWKSMREQVISNFSIPPGISKETEKSIRIITEIYKQDAYHSLSIEGYQVTQELIAQIEANAWDPEKNLSDQQQRDAMAARGYFNAFNAVVGSLRRVLEGEPSWKRFSDDLQAWYRELFSPSVQAGILRASDLAGYRNSPVYIENSRHVPPGPHSVLDAMDALFIQLQKEDHAGVRAVLGHFIFVYIHPYMDGNGRIGRFLMNLMLVSGGYDWTVIRVERRSEYMASLEKASTAGDITDFSKFVHSEMQHWQAKQGLRK